MSRSVSNRRRRTAAIRGALVFVAAALGAAAWLAGGAGSPAPATPAAPEAAAAPAAFVGSSSCRACHEEQYRTWLQTGHAHALRAADESVMEGRFDGQPVDAAAFTAVPYRKHGAYYVEVKPKDGRSAGDHKVTRVVGRTVEQMYLFTGAHGAWRVLPICWNVERGTWDATHDVLAAMEGHAGNVTDTRDVVFNDGCGHCHATGFDPGYVADSGTYRPRLVEGAVACESCHGPGSNHASWHAGEATVGEPAPLLHPARDLDAAGVLGSCGRCHVFHEWRYAVDDDPRVPFHDVAVSRDGHAAGGFFADGRLSGQRYHGTTQGRSPCFLNGGMSCLHCHRMHGGHRRAMRWEERSTDAQCAQCHDDVARAGRGHTFHADVRCVDCHMPRLAGGPLHAMRDHRVRSPEPELTERFGTDHARNACATCHANRTPGWAREWKDRWWKPAPRQLVEDTALVVALARDAASVATARLVKAATRTDGDRFVRLTALDHLAVRTGDADARATIRAALADGDPEIVQRACAALARSPDPAAAGPLLGLLADPVRTVRVDAAYALARAGWRHEFHPAPAGVWRDAAAMRTRRTPDAALLARLATLADALGQAGATEECALALVRRFPLEAWTGPMAQALHRHARRVAEAGRHVEALEMYETVRVVYDRVGVDVGLLWIDFTDSLAGAGAPGQPERHWRHVVQNYPPETPAHAIARARLATLEGRPADGPTAALRAHAARLEKDPAGGEALRRVTWSLRVLVRTGG